MPLRLIVVGAVVVVIVRLLKVILLG